MLDILLFPSLLIVIASVPSDLVRAMEDIKSEVRVIVPAVTLSGVYELIFIVLVSHK